MQRKTLMLLLLPFFVACQAQPHTRPQILTTEDTATTRPLTATKITEIPLPAGFSRDMPGTASFGYWLGNIKLRPDKTVYLYNGAKKRNQGAQFAVLDIPVGSKDLQQCADAVMRLRAGWLFDHQRYDEIMFRDNENVTYRFSAPYTEIHFTQYLERVFGMCGTASLAKQLKTINPEKIQAGDVLIRGGFPGHAVIVVDLATNEQGKTIYMLAQSYMPAQDIHILLNPMSDTLSPWFELNNDEQIVTPEWTFKRSEWKTW